MSEVVDITLAVNGRAYAMRLEPRRTLLDAIRDKCGLTGTHMGCEHGVCGACTVLVDGEPIRSCLIFAVQAQAGRRGARSSLIICRASADARNHPPHRPAARHRG